MEIPSESFDFEKRLEELVVEQARKLINQNNYTKSILSTLPIALIATDKDGKIRSYNNTAKVLLNLAEGKNLTEFFIKIESLKGKIENCLYKEEKYTLSAIKIITKEGEENVVNIYLQPLYDDELNIYGLLMAIEDQTYISFLESSILRYTTPHNDSDIIAEISLTKRLLTQIKDSSKTDDVILFTGKRGTGKTFFANKFHAEHAESHNPFIVIDCIEIKDKNPIQFLLPIIF